MKSHRLLAAILVALLLVIGVAMLIPAYLISDGVESFSGPEQVFARHALREAGHLFSNPIEQRFILRKLSVVRVEADPSHRSGDKCGDLPYLVEGGHRGVVEAYTWFGIPYGYAIVTCTGAAAYRWPFWQAKPGDNSELKTGPSSEVATPQIGTPDAGKQLPRPSGEAGFKVEPLSPGVKGSNALATGNLQIRAMVELDKSAEPACIRLELNGRRLEPEVLEWEYSKINRTRRILIRAKQGDLADGNYTVRLHIEDKEGRSSEEKWSFAVASQETGDTLEDRTELILYFADNPLVVAGFPAEWGYVTPVRRRVAKTTRPALRAVEELIAGPRPEDGEVSRTIPSTVRIIGVWIKDGSAYVNFSREFSRDHWGGTTGGAITTQSIIYTLTELAGIDAVQVLVEGEPWNDGHFEWDQPLPRPQRQLERLRISDCD